MLELLLTNCKL